MDAMPKELHAAFPQWLEELQRSPGLWRADVRATALRHGVLPLYVTADGFYALGAEGEVVHLRWQDDPLAVISERERIRALAQGARQHPELELLLPERPLGARTCERCRGSGIDPRIENLACECDGLGWIAEPWSVPAGA